MPDAFAVIVVDNGSGDGTAEVARRLGATVVVERVPGYGSAVHAGLLAARREQVAFMDGDGSFDPDELLPLLDDVRCGPGGPRGGPPPPGGGRGVALARPGRERAWSCAGCVTASACRPTTSRPCGCAAARTCSRSSVRDRRFGYPVELLDRATRAGWRFCEREVSYHPRAEGTRSKVSGSVVGTVRTARDFWKVLA